MDSEPDDNRESPEPPEDVTRPEELEEQPTQEAADAPEAPETAEPGPAPRRPRAEEALAAMRADLREEETKQQAGARGLRGLVQRIFRRRRAPSPEEPDVPSRLDALQFPEPPPKAEVRTQPEAGAAAAEAPVAEPPTPEAKPDFQSMVRDRLTEAWTTSVQREPLEMEPPAPVEEEEQRPAHSMLSTLRQDQTEEVTSEPVDFRQAALEDYVVGTPEPEESGAPGMRKLRTSWRYMRRTEKRMLIGALVIIGLAVLGGAGYAAYQSIPTPTAVVTPTLPITPIPISVSLPGGWVFPLNVGYVNEGQWNPRSAEWLSGTEICRWVSLPWTVQLEAVLRTLKANDEIQLSMSNYDSIAYKVKSIEQVPSSSINKRACDSPALLVSLSKEDSDQRWVVMAKP